MGEKVTNCTKWYVLVLRTEKAEKDKKEIKGCNGRGGVEIIRTSSVAY